MQRHQQEALWEFVHTELTYINKLIIIKDLVVAALVNLHQHGFLSEVTPELLFSNLFSILTAHQLFWKEVIYPMLHEAQTTGKPFDPMRLEAGCLQFHERFSCYKDYCWEEENNLEFTRRQMESNPHFLTYVQWVETHPQCERMRLGDMQAKPHQRITKYPLLLKAVLRSTQDPHVQYTLRSMLSSVNGFLESINDYLKLKDEELALSISAQRVEGYKVEGINEEIDKHVKEISQFDLTCPISGVGPKVVRRLLLEENLKIRGRKDSKLEVVALLFSDVLLMTKVQKKGERLKVVRPPLALDRTHCVALKDGCSFVLVEVGELCSVMNVYIFAASTSESCSRWVSAIHNAKEIVRNLRQRETNRQLENWKFQQFEARSSTDVEPDDLDTDQTFTQSDEETFTDEPTDEQISHQSMNGMLESHNAEEHCQPDDFASNKSGSAHWLPQPIHKKHKSVHKRLYGHQQMVKGPEWIEMGLRGDQGGNQIEEEDKIVESQMTNEQRVAFNHRASHLDNLFRSTPADSSRYNLNGPHALSLGELPDVDYPTNEDSTLQCCDQPTISREDIEFQRLPQEVGISTRRNSDSQSVKRDTSRSSIPSDSDDMETFKESWGFFKNLKSPGLQRKRPVSTLQNPLAPTTKHESRETFAASNSNSSPYYGSDYNLNNKRKSISTGQSKDSHRVLKLGSLKFNQGMFWSMHDRVLTDYQALSESELPDPDFQNKKLKMKTQRRSSISGTGTEESYRLHLTSSSLCTLQQEQKNPSVISENNLNGPPSPLEGLLERAKGRLRDRDGLKRDRNLKTTNMSSGNLFPPPMFSTTLSPSPGDGERDTELGEKEVELTRHRASTVSEGWKEQLVDEDDDERRNGLVPHALFIV
ncbi:Pleckstrin -like proteiny domain-containing family G member 6 [Channa argus]|uniref:Pleckstrin-like proteiny domain-containing family G member 6 n=1 Tax=Channa argus TaxID=215402 RepID=A0A6G1PPC0_CHAAH|nr:Pleckstrin -like proteiny domain-containing family G member 6 [Channa argus]